MNLLKLMSDKPVDVKNLGSKIHIKCIYQIKALVMHVTNMQQHF